MDASVVVEFEFAEFYVAFLVYATRTFAVVVEQVPFSVVIKISSPRKDCVMDLISSAISGLLPTAVNLSSRNIIGSLP